MVNVEQVDWEPNKYLIKFFITSREQSSCTFSEGKQNVHIFIQVSKRRKRENILKIRRQSRI